MNKKLFKSTSVNKSVVLKPVNAVNEAGGAAYDLNDQATLATLVLTGTFQNVFYASAEDQLSKVLELANKCPVEYVAKLSIYARKEALMKDSPALLAAVVASKNVDLFAKIFDRVIDNPKMFRVFIQTIRSGVAGRKSFGNRPKKLLNNYLNKLTDEQLFNANIGTPSFHDCLKMLHPKPNTKKRSALYAYLLDKEYNKRDLLPLAKEFEAFKKEMGKEIPNVPFQMLTALPLTDRHWKQIAENATWTQCRMNLNTFLRHNVFSDPKMVDVVAAKLIDAEQIKKARAFPYQLFAAFKHVEDNMPGKIKLALQRAAEIALENVPEFEGQVYIFPDVSGSMRDPITGRNGTATSKIRCVDVAALIASAVLRKNPEAVVIPFDTKAHNANINPLDALMTNCEKLAAYGGGGTACQIPLQKLNQHNIKGDVIFYVSDNQSWYQNQNSGQFTGMALEWATFKKRNPNAKLICLDVAPYTTAQINEQKDVLHIAGFSDNVFSVIEKFVSKDNNKDFMVKMVEEIKL